MRLFCAWIFASLLLASKREAKGNASDPAQGFPPGLTGKDDDPRTLQGLRALYESTNGTNWKNPVAGIACRPGIDIAAEIGSLGGSFSFNLLLDNARPGLGPCLTHQECLNSKAFLPECYYNYYERPFFTPDVTLCLWEGTSCCLPYSISMGGNVSADSDFFSNRTIFQIQPGYRVFSELFQPSIESLDSQGLEVVLAYECQIAMDLRALGLANYNLTGSLPSQMGLLDRLEWLDFSNNKGLVGEIPEEMEVIRYMISADFRNTSLHCGTQCPLPGFLAFGNQTIQTQYPGMSCNITATKKVNGKERNTTEFVASGVYALDPDYFNFESCVCGPGYEAVYSTTRDSKRVMRCELSSGGNTPWLAIMLPVGLFLILIALIGWRYHAIIYKEIRANRVARIKRSSTPGLLVGKNLQYVMQWQGLPPESPVEISMVVTDVKGSSSLWEWNGNAMDTATQIHDKLMRDLIPKFCGYEVTTEGDSFTIAFHDPMDAVQYCLAAQVALLEQDWPDSLAENEFAETLIGDNDEILFKGLRVRMAIATGTVDRIKMHSVTKRAEYFGGIAHEVVDISHYPDGGQILVNRITYDRLIPRMSGFLAAMSQKPDKTTKAPNFFIKAIRTTSKALTKKSSWKKSSYKEEDPMLLDTEDTVPVVIDMGTHVIQNIAHASGKDLETGVDLVQVLPARLLPRSCCFSKLETPLQLAPGFFDAPMAMEGLQQMLSKSVASDETRLQLDNNGNPKWTKFSFQASMLQSIQAVTIVFCSIEKYAEISAYDPKIAESALGLYLEVIRKTLLVCNGYECQEQEGTLMVAFSTAVQAVKWCLLVQESLMEVDWDPRLLQIKAASEAGIVEDKDGSHLSPSLTHETRFLWRGLRACMGLFEGVPVAVCPHRSTGRADYFGTFVNRSARMMGASLSGEILLPMELAERVLLAISNSNRCSDDEHHVMEYELHDAGSYRFKGVPGEMQVALLLPSDLGGRLKQRTSRQALITSKHARLHPGTMEMRKEKVALPNVSILPS